MQSSNPPQIPANEFLTLRRTLSYLSAVILSICFSICLPQSPFHLQVLTFSHFLAFSFLPSLYCIFLHFLFMQFSWDLKVNFSRVIQLPFTFLHSLSLITYGFWRSTSVLLRITIRVIQFSFTFLHFLSDHLWVLKVNFSSLRITIKVIQLSFTFFLWSFMGFGDQFWFFKYYAFSCIGFWCRCWRSHCAIILDILMLLSSLTFRRLSEWTIWKWRGASRSLCTHIRPLPVIKQGRLMASMGVKDSSIRISIREGSWPEILIKLTFSSFPLLVILFLLRYNFHACWYGSWKFDCNWSRNFECLIVISIRSQGQIVSLMKGLMFILLCTGKIRGWKGYCCPAFCQQPYFWVSLLEQNFRCWSLLHNLCRHSCDC